MERGWIKLHRKTIDSAVFRNPDLFMFWSYCLMKASHKPIAQMVGFQTVHLDPGQFIFGRRQAAKELPLSERTIRTCLKKLENSRNLTIKTTQKFSVISVVNWEIYQSNDLQNVPTNDLLVTHKRPTGDHKQEQKNKRIKKTYPHSNSSNGGSSDLTFSELLCRYSPDEQQIIQEAFKAIALTRTSGKVKHSILISELRYWSEFETWKVIGGIRKYLEQEHHLAGKKEQYLRGIIRGMRQPASLNTGNMSTGSNLLDAYYKDASHAR